MSTVTDQLNSLDYARKADLLSAMANQEINVNRKDPKVYIHWLRKELKELWEETIGG